MKPLRAEPEDIPLDIVYEDDHVLVVNKPAHMVISTVIEVSFSVLVMHFSLIEHSLAHLVCSDKNNNTSIPNLVGTGNMNHSLTILLRSFSYCSSLAHLGSIL